MKSLHIASIFALTLTLTLACGDDDSDSPAAAGSSGAAAGGDNGAGEGPLGGKGGTEAGGAGGAPAETCDFGVYEDAVESAAGAGGQASAAHELVGTWEEEFVGSFEITSAHWGSSGIAAYDSEANVLYTQSPCDAAYNPGRFSKIVYTEPTEDAFYYCTVVFDATTLEEARASEATADPEDLDAGCGQSGFPWSKATR